MCADLMDLDHVAQSCGWYGWSEGPAADDMVIYKCGCDEEHVTYVARTADDVDYYEERANFIRRCRT